MAPDSRAIDTAIVDRLNADPALKALVPDGVFFGAGPPGAQRFAVVALEDEDDVAEFGRRTMESGLYAIEAVMLSTAGGDDGAAAWRIDQLLEDVPIAAAGYDWMTTFRLKRIRRTVPDEIDPGLRWFRAGGVYRVDMAVGAGAATEKGIANVD